MSPNSKTVLGTGSGSNIEYSIVAKYGLPLTLECTPFGSDKFLGWYKDGIKIADPTNFLNFNDGETIEARFGKMITINIQHIGNGKGETKVTQERQIVGESNGLNSYSVQVVDSIPVQLDHSVSNEATVFIGWKDAEGNKLDIRDLQLVDGMTIYAEFDIKAIDIIIVHKGAEINSSASQDGILIGSKIGKDVNYMVKLRVDKNLSISHNAIDSAYVFESIKDEFGKTYSDIIAMSDLRAGMTLTITYKLNNVDITINHVGNGSGQSNVTQGATTLGNGSGQNISYIISPTMTEPFTINAIADTHYELIEMQDGNGNIIPSTLSPSQFYSGMVINIIFGLESVPPSTGGSDGSNIYHEQVYGLGSRGGIVNIDYYMGDIIPDKMEVWYRGEMILSTDSVAGNTTEQWSDASGNIFTESGFVKDEGTLSFSYQPVDFDYNLKIVIKPALDSGTYWEYTVHPPI